MGKNIISNTAEMNALLTWHYTYIITVVTSFTVVCVCMWKVNIGEWKQYIFAYTNPQINFEF